MPAIDRRSLQNFDWTLLGLVAILATLGLVNLFSATHQPDGLSDEMRRQLLSFGIGVGVALVVHRRSTTATTSASRCPLFARRARSADRSRW